jgi:hypothetical protein
MTDRHLIFGCTFDRTKTLAAVSKGANLSLSAVPFSKGTSTASVCQKVINELSLPVDFVWHVYIFLNLPFSLLLVCVCVCVFAIF